MPENLNAKIINCRRQGILRSLVRIRFAGLIFLLFRFTLKYSAINTTKIEKIYLFSIHLFFYIYNMKNCICLGRQTKQIMVAKFQTPMCLFANTESSPNSSKRLLPLICTLTPKNKGEITA
jgi:hypothetical protein